MKKQILLCILSATLPSQLFGLCELTKPIREFFIDLLKNPYNFNQSTDSPENAEIIGKELVFFNIFEEATSPNPSEESVKSALAINLFKHGLLALTDQINDPKARYSDKVRANVSKALGFAPDFFDKKFMMPLQELVQTDLQNTLSSIKGFVATGNSKAIAALNRYLTSALLWQIEKTLNGLDASHVHEHASSDPNEIHTLAPLIIKALEQDPQYVTTLKKTLLYKEVTAAGLPQHLTKLNDSLAALAARV